MTGKRHKRSAKALCALFWCLWCIGYPQRDYGQDLPWRLTGYPLSKDLYTATFRYDLYSDTVAIKKYLLSADTLLGPDPDSARSLLSFCLEQSRQRNFSYGIAHALNSLGLCLQNQGQYDSSIQFFNKAIDLLNASGNKKQLYKCYLNMGNSYFYKGAYEKALECYNESLKRTGKFMGKLGYRDSAYIYTNIGMLWSRMGEPKQAMDDLRIVEGIAGKARDTVLLANIYLSFGSVAVGNDPRQALPYYFKALEIGNRKNIPALSIPALNELAHVYTALGQPEKTLQYATEACNILAAYPGAYNFDRFHAEHNLGKAYLELKDYRKAREILVPVFERATALGFKDLIPHIEPDIAEMYAANDQYREAYRHMQHYALLKDTLLEQEKARMLEAWIRSRNSEKDRAMMAQQLHITQQQKQLQAKNFLIGGIAMGVLLLLVLFIYFLRNYRNRQNLQQAYILQLQQEQQINQLKAQVRGEEQERNRLARELHDGIASQLWAIKLNVDSLQHQNGWEEPQKNRLSAIYQQLDDTTQDVRKTAHNLMPDLLLNEGLATALASLCEKIRIQTGIEVDFLEYGQVPRMDEEIELTLYRMIQELIQNVMKHAGSATQLLVQLSCIDVLLNITVEDNGCGFGEAEEAGTGLQHIRKRVADLRGQMDLQSIPGKGTTIYLEFDIQHLL